MREQNQPFYSESNLEDRFCNYLSNQDGHKVIGRQLPTITGRLDVLFARKPAESDCYSELYLVEIKNRKLKQRDITQLLTYHAELCRMLSQKYNFGHYDETRPYINFLPESITPVFLTPRPNHKLDKYIAMVEPNIEVWQAEPTLNIKTRAAASPYDYRGARWEPDFLTDLEEPIKEQFKSFGFDMRGYIDKRIEKIKDFANVIWDANIYKNNGDDNES